METGQNKLNGKRTKKKCDSCGIDRNKVTEHKGKFYCGRCIRYGKHTK
jgi:ribosomal protein S27AE